jgi:pimeloyl-ACP methyl ester carboxylesterase
VTERSDPWFDVTGKTDAPGIVLVHGAVVTRKIWLRQLRGLSDTYLVIAPDLPGHGALAEEPFTFDAALTRLADIIEREAHGRALVVGLSLGGYIAMELAHHHPELVAGLVLSGCSFNFRGLAGWYIKVVSLILRRGWVKPTRPQMEKRIMRVFPPDLADVAEAQLRAGVYPEPVGPAYGEIAGKDFRPSMAAFPRPVLILNGEKDWFPRLGAATFEAASRVVRVQTVSGAGHACNLDQPEKFNQAVRNFAQSIGWGHSTTTNPSDSPG